MTDYLVTTFEISPWLARVLLILIFFAVAYLLHRLAPRLARRLLHLRRLAPRTDRLPEERQMTLHGLLASTISVLAFVLASLASLGLFVNPATLLWVVGLFSAGFGLGARNLINDFVSGLGFMFEDNFDVGEKIAVLEVEGVVEAVNLRTTSIRDPNGELVIVPNGDIRLIRNYSRGRFSATDVTIRIASSDLGVALPILEALSVEAVELLPNLLEPWRVISQSGVIAQETELTILARARFGRGAEMRTRLLALVHERLAEANVALAD